VKTYDGQAVPQGGCSTSAVSQLAQRGIDLPAAQPNDSDAESLVAQIQTNSFEQAQSDPRVLTVFGEWSACMRANGDDYQSPFAAAGDPRWGTAAPTAPEIGTAEHDLACKLRVNLSGVESVVVSEYQNAAITENAPALAAAKERIAGQAVALQFAMHQFGA
jgi:hypothetical protein